jgi:cysteinylglycine-S-conjugate dipeptidase
MAHAMRDVHGRDVSLLGDGGSIPLRNVLEATFPDAQIRMPEVEEPEWPIRAPNDSVDPSEIEGHGACRSADPPGVGRGMR